jgi:hypothetical protein
MQTGSVFGTDDAAVIEKIANSMVNPCAERLRRV